MKRSLFLWQFGGFTFAVVFGTLLHFLFEFTGSTLVTPISAVNESTWEHMKILFFPMLFYAIFEWFFLKKEYGNYWNAKLFGTLLGVELIPILFYTFKGCFGAPPDWLNILFFFVSAFLAYYYEALILKSGKYKKFNVISIILLFLTAVLFIVFTYFTPRLPLFLDPVTNKYSIV
ncbi:MAG: hypothetical protein IKV61_00640 [Clostridia bacterium]|nr:hypothetical protein [Clostridia bacterium]